MLQKLFLLLALVATGLAQSSCPPADLLAPCECNEADLSITCSGVDTPDIDLKVVFDRVSPLVGSNVTFSHLNISRLPSNYTELQAETISTLKFRQITLYNNFDLKTIHPGAFNGTYATTTELHLERNLFVNGDDDSYYSVFKFISEFKNLESVFMRELHLKTIPAEPFGPLPALTSLEIHIWQLESVGSRWLSNLPALQRAKLGYQHMDAAAGFALDAFDGISPDAEVNLEYNPSLRYLPESIFKPFLDNGNNVLTMGGEECGLGACWPIYQNCREEEAAWLCPHRVLYEPKLKGYYCFVNKSIWKWCEEIGATTESTLQ